MRGREGGLEGKSLHEAMDYGRAMAEYSLSHCCNTAHDDQTIVSVSSVLCGSGIC